MITPPVTPRKRYRNKAGDFNPTPSKRRKSLPMARQPRRGRRIKKQYKYKSPAYKKKVNRNRKKAKKSYNKSASKSVLKKSTYQSLGFVQNEEAYGTVKDLDCVYVGHTTYHALLFSKVIAFAMVRKLLNKMGVYPTAVDINIDLGNRQPNDSRGYIFILNMAGISEAEAGTQFEYASIQDMTVTDIVNGLGLPTKIELQMLNGGPNVVDLDGEPAEFLQLSCIYADGSNAAARAILASVDFRNEKLSVYCRSELVIQNRTKGASSTDVDSTAVDNQALQGMLYQGKGIPQTKTTGDMFSNQIFDLNRTTQSGLILAQANGSSAVGAVQSAMHSSFKEPPTPNTFMNVNYSKNLLVQSGQYGRFTIYSTFNGLFNQLIGRTLNVRGQNSAVNVWRKVIRAPGKFQFLGLEEVLNSGSLNSIDVAWQVQRTVGAFLKTTKKRIMLVPTTDVITNINDA